MRKFIFLLTILAMCVCAYGQDASDLLGQRRVYIASGNSNLDPLYTWAYWIQNQVVGGGSVGTGNVYYVDSNVSVEGDGTSWDKAKDTLDEAINLCTADNGDIILVAQGHTETMGAAADEVDADVGGITIIGCGQIGNVDTMPYLDYTGDVTGAFAVGADGVTLINLRYHANITDVNEAIEVESGSTDCTVGYCIFDLELEGTDDFLECVDSVGGTADRLRVIGCQFRMGAGACNAAINTKDADYMEIIGNDVEGDYAVACIKNNTTASNHIVIRDNRLFNGTIGGDTGLNTEPCIELLATTTGVIANNVVVCDVANIDAAIVGAYCYLLDNVYSEEDGQSLNPLAVLCSDTTDAVDMTPEIPDETILANILDDGGDTSSYDRRYHSLVALGTDTDAILADTVAQPAIVSYTTEAMTAGNGYDAGDDPNIFTVTGDILCRAVAYVSTKVTSTSNDGTLELGVTGATACLCVQDTMDNTAFDTGDTWGLDTAADAPGAALTTDWVVIGGGLDVKLTIATHGCTAGVMNIYLQWMPLSADGAVVAAGAASGQ